MMRGHLQRAGLALSAALITLSLCHCSSKYCPEGARQFGNGPPSATSVICKKKTEAFGMSKRWICQKSSKTENCHGNRRPVAGM